MHFLIIVNEIVSASINSKELKHHQTQEIVLYIPRNAHAIDNCCDLEVVKCEAPFERINKIS